MGFASFEHPDFAVPSPAINISTLLCSPTHHSSPLDGSCVESRSDMAISCCNFERHVASVGSDSPTLKRMKLKTAIGQMSHDFHQLTLKPGRPTHRADLTSRARPDMPDQMPGQ